MSMINPVARQGDSAATADAGEDDRTLGGYLLVHKRPPAFEACDGFPYTVSIEIERTANLRTPVAAYLIFPRWAGTGAGIVGHLETGLLWRGATSAEAVAKAEAVSLHEVQRLLNEVVRQQGGAVPDGRCG